MRDVKGVEFGVAYIPNAPTERFVARARWLEEVGVNQIWIPDERFYRDCWVLMGMIGQATKSLQIGTSVTDPYVRHPALTANAIASLDEATNGRATLGIGAGGSGFKQLGFGRPSPATALRQGIDAMRRLMRGDEITVEGQTFHMRDLGLYWRPPRMVPIVLAARGPALLSLGAEIGDGVMIASFSSGPPLDYAFGRVELGLARRAPELGECKKFSWLYTCVGPDRAATKQPVKQGITAMLMGSLPILGKIGIELPRELDEYLRTVPIGFSPTVVEKVVSMIPDEIVENLSLSGTPEDCAEKIANLAARGIDHIAIWPFAAEGEAVDETVTRFVDQVIPLVRSS